MSETPTFPKLDLEDTRQRLQRIVGERPDYVYRPPADATGCLYVHPELNDEEEIVDRKPGCIVGQLLADIGVPLEVLEKNEYIYADSLVKRLGMAELDSPVARYLATVQSRQDNDLSWSEALEAGEKELTYLRAREERKKENA